MGIPELLVMFYAWPHGLVCLNAAMREQPVILAPVQCGLTWFKVLTLFCCQLAPTLAKLI